jgi:aminocarboxymuconate-semialdehyde decarboxylase
MITGGIASRHPKLRIAFSHGGGTMSILLPRLVHAWNNFPKAKESLSESPATIARRFYYDELVFEPRAVRFLVETFGQTQIVVGTDYPFALGDWSPLKTLEAAGLDAGTLAAVTAGNAKRFLGLPAGSR